MRYLTTGDIAKTCEVSVNTVKRWIQRGILHAFPTPGGHLRITVEEFQRFRTAYPFVPERMEPPRILVVDDDPASVELCRTVLRLLPVDAVVQEASGGYEALLKIGSFRPHVVLLDLQMPDLDGFEVCHRLKATPATHPLHIIVLTAHADAATEERARQCGVDVFLPKPLVLHQLLAAVARLLRLDPEGAWLARLQAAEALETSSPSPSRP